ncbi:MAG: hypothetical protein ACI4EF_13395 [Coprococcus sp.]
MYKNKRFDLYLLKNTLMSILPALIVIIVMMILITHFNISERLSFEYLGSPAALDSSYEKRTYNVCFHIDRADYMGYDYYLDDKLAGRYYYAFIDGRCMVFLIDSRDDVILDYDVKGVVKADTALYQYLISQCALDMGIDTEQFQKVTYDYVISEVDYPKVFYEIIRLVIILILLISMIIVLEGIYHIIFPWKTRSVKSINGVANGKLVVKDLNNQLRDKLLLKQKDIIVTEKYLVAPSLFHTDVILIDHIEVLSKHMERKKHLLLKNRDIYKLIISDSEDMFYEQEFENEQLIDEVIPLLEKKE